MPILEITTVFIAALATINTVSFSILKYHSHMKEQIENDAKESILYTYVKYSKDVKLSKIEEIINNKDLNIDQKLRENIKLYIYINRNSKLNDIEIENCTAYAKHYFLKKNYIYHLFSKKKLKNIIDEQWQKNKHELNDMVIKMAEFIDHIK